MAVALDWIRPPAQDRSARTLERLLDAAERLLADRTFDALTVADLVAEARSSVGSFYARFRDKDGLLRALWERYAAEGRETAAAALSPAIWEGRSVAELADALSGFLVAQTRHRPGLRRALVAAQTRDTVVREGARALTQEVVGRLATLLTARPDLRCPDPALAAEMVHRIAFAVLDQDVLYAPEGPAGQAWSDALLARQLSLAIQGYLAEVGR